jgi:hypothetical protein
VFTPTLGKLDQNTIISECMLESAWPSVYVYSPVCGQTNTDSLVRHLFSVLKSKQKSFHLLAIKGEKNLDKRGEKFEAKQV